MQRITFITYTLLFLTFYSAAQKPILDHECSEEFENSIENYKGMAVLVSGDLSYMGYSLGLLFEYERKFRGLYAGPQILLSDTYLPVKGPVGINAGYKFYFLNTMKRWRAYVNLDYKNFVYKAYNRFGDLGSKNNYIHEFNIGYGAEFRFWGPFSIGNTIAVGQYFESYYSYRSEKRYTFNGFDGLIRFFLKYKVK